MDSVRRIISRSIAILCGVLAIVCLVMQVVTFWRSHIVAVRMTDSLLIGAVGEYGSVGVGAEWSQGPPGDERFYYETSAPNPVQRTRFAGFIWHIDDDYAVIGIPGALAAAGFGFVAYWLWRGRRKTIAGVCKVCGYDLRASPKRCPECGTSIEIVRDASVAAEC
jgi:hypothetical protein